MDQGQPLQKRHAMKLKAKSKKGNNSCFLLERESDVAMPREIQIMTGTRIHVMDIVHAAGQRPVKMSAVIGGSTLIVCDHLRAKEMATTVSNCYN